MHGREKQAIKAGVARGNGGETSVVVERAGMQIHDPTIPPIRTLTSRFRTWKRTESLGFFYCGVSHANEVECVAVSHDRLARDDE
ncbi:MAG: hypothetical protein ACI9OJ_005127 [Myxococcota bacterium]|jgi:hypothetical protein